MEEIGAGDEEGQTCSYKQVRGCNVNSVGTTVSNTTVAWVTDGN